MSNEKQQTAVDELWDYLKGWIPAGQYAGVREAYLEAKEKEKEQIMSAFNIGEYMATDYFYGEDNCETNYYNETYGGNK